MRDSDATDCGDGDLPRSCVLDSCHRASSLVSNGEILVRKRTVTAVASTTTMAAARQSGKSFTVLFFRFLSPRRAPATVRGGVVLSRQSLAKESRISLQSIYLIQALSSDVLLDRPSPYHTRAIKKATTPSHHATRRSVSLHGPSMIKPGLFTFSAERAAGFGLKYIRRTPPPPG